MAVRQFLVGEATREDPRTSQRGVSRGRAAWDRRTDTTGQVGAVHHYPGGRASGRTSARGGRSNRQGGKSAKDGEVGEGAGKRQAQRPREEKWAGSGGGDRERGTGNGGEGGAQRGARYPPTCGGDVKEPLRCCAEWRGKAATVQAAAAWRRRDVWTSAGQNRSLMVAVRIGEPARCAGPALGLGARWRARFGPPHVRVTGRFSVSLLDPNRRDVVRSVRLVPGRAGPNGPSRRARALRERRKCACALAWSQRRGTGLLVSGGGWWGMDGWGSYLDLHRLENRDSGFCRASRPCRVPSWPPRVARSAAKGMGCEIGGDGPR